MTTFILIVLIALTAVIILLQLQITWIRGDLDELIRRERQR